MPYVNIRVAGQLNKDQKEEICAGVTEVISRSTHLTSHDNEPSRVSES